jgi:hypothetical protein
MASRKVDPDTGEITEPTPEPEPDLVAEAEKVFEGEIARSEPRFKPNEDSFVQLRGRGGGGSYLPARRRIMWMRGEPDEHPDWTIETQEIKVVEGTFKPPASVSGGYARIKANVYDSSGRLIASGTKTEYSERFTDFVEKAETGAIARALAVAGYGTEAALDLDEGVEDGRIADAPVPGSATGRPIQISASAVPGLKQGGRSEHVTDAQLAEIARLNRELSLGLNLTAVIESATGVAVSFPESMKDPADMQKVILATLRSLTFEQGGQIIQSMTKALANRDA